MKIKNINITDVGGISELFLANLNSQINIICGENGVGKTNILDSIAFCFSEFDANTLGKRSGSVKGEIKIETTEISEGKPISFSIDVNDFEPTESDKYIQNPLYHNHKQQMLYLKTSRGINYRKIAAIQSDPDVTHRARNNTSGINNGDIKEWLLNRVLHSKHANHLSETQLSNLELSKKCFSILNPEYSYSRLDTKNEIFLMTPTGEIYFEYLSSGFKSIVYILLGLIKEIDYRFEKNRIAAADYGGIILIDEIELHLHPEWQGKICTILKEIFPKAQFFITTHSPHVVQTAAHGEVIALERNNSGIVSRRSLPVSEYGYQGWTVEEILEDVMGMPDLRTRKYDEIKQKFDCALENGDREMARLAYQQLDKILHPQYPLRPVFKIQLDKILDGEQ